MTRATTAPDLDERHEALRGDLLAHCCRMPGSVETAPRGYVELLS